jgi:hypothetical protein
MTDSEAPKTLAQQAADKAKTESKEADTAASSLAKEQAKAEKANPANPRFPGEGNPDFKG